jgi:aminoglycoside 3-N-acetyltransferase
VRPGATPLVHTPLRAAGFVVGGGPSAALHARLETLGPEGPLPMPKHDRDLSEPVPWRDPPAAPALPGALRAGMPPWDAERTASPDVGVVAEPIRRWPGVRRSGPPRTSLAAVGSGSDDRLAGHEPGCALYRAGGGARLVAFDHGRDGSLHPAKHRARWASRRELEEGAPLFVDGERRWVRFPERAFDDGGFAEPGAAFEAAGGPVAVGAVGHAGSRLLPRRPLVEFAVPWLEAHR